MTSVFYLYVLHSGAHKEAVKMATYSFLLIFFFFFILRMRLTKITKYVTSWPNTGD